MATTPRTVQKAFKERIVMSNNPYHQNPDEFTPLVDAVVRQVGTLQDGCPYLVLEKLQEQLTFYVIIQADAEGNCAGYSHLTTRQNRTA